jgi:hypothetical protein
MELIYLQVSAIRDLTGYGYNDGYSLWSADYVLSPSTMIIVLGCRAVGRVTAVGSGPSNNSDFTSCPTVEFPRLAQTHLFQMLLLQMLGPPLNAAQLTHISGCDMVLLAWSACA